MRDSTDITHRLTRNITSRMRAWAEQHTLVQVPDVKQLHFCSYQREWVALPTLNPKTSRHAWSRVS